MVSQKHIFEKKKMIKHAKEVPATAEKKMEQRRLLERSRKEGRERQQSLLRDGEEEEEELHQSTLEVFENLHYSRLMPFYEGEPTPPPCIPISKPLGRLVLPPMK